MSWIDSLAGIASNVGLGKLAPTNGDAFREAYGTYRRNSILANTARSSSREGASKQGEFFDNTSKEYAKKMDAAEKLGHQRSAKGHAARSEGYAYAGVNYRTAKGLGLDADVKGTKLSPEELDKFRDLNRDNLTTYRKNQKAASKELRGLAKGYYFSDDLGANALRWGATAAAYGGVATGTRAITGGSATTNNQGQRDIAGIPFI